MSTLTLGAIWAQDNERAIGSNGSIPWDLPEDLAHFANTTAGSVVIMGRATWESLPTSARPLPGRSNIVVTSRKDYEAPGARIASSFEDACELAERLTAHRPTAKTPDAWVIGGASLYEAAIDDPRTVKAVVTNVVTRSEGADAFAPDLDKDSRWTLSESSPLLCSRTGLHYSICVFVRDEPHDRA